MRPAEDRLLRQLARLYGVQTEYRDVENRLQEAQAESLWHVLRILGAELEDRRDLARAVMDRRRQWWSRPVPPVLVVWLKNIGPASARPVDGAGREKAGPLRAPPVFPLHLLLAHTRAVEIELSLEDGTVRRARVHPDELQADEAVEVGGRTFVRYLVPLRELIGDLDIPPGYHRLRICTERPTGDPQAAPSRSPQASTDTDITDCLLIAAPDRAWSPAGRRSDWGVFLPLYALRTRDDWGSGDFGGLARLAEWTAELGGRTVGTLPLLATYLDEPFAPSPYVPATRLFWNEFFLDVEAIPELQRCPSAQDRMTSGELRREKAELRDAPVVDYRRAMAAKRRVLEKLSRCFFRGEPGGRTEDFRRFVERRPRVEDYARFRAVTDLHKAGWPNWPESLHGRSFRPDDYSADDYDYHLYVQWLAHEQLTSASREPWPDDENGGLYLDMPLGVHPFGYDTWREGDTFASGAAGGAPPDSFFAGGQNWGFPPLHPERMREKGYAYLREALATQMAHASLLRIDHVMALHRLFWIPDGMSPTEGVYVTYPAEELYAVLSVESHRNRTVLIGEDLGTVPEYVRPAMKEHGLRRMYVLGYELSPDRQPLGEVPPDSLAALNTHDMPPFAGFFRGTDLEERVSAGHLDPADVADEERERSAMLDSLERYLGQHGYLQDQNPSDGRAHKDDSQRESPSDERLARLLRGALRFLADSDAETVLVNLEDLLLSPTPQNMPGTSGERPNWRVRVEPTLARLRGMADVRETLCEVERLRKRRGSR